MARPAEHYRVDPDGHHMKWCPDCQDFRPVGEFGQAAGRPDGLSSYCRMHATARSRMYHNRAPRTSMDRAELFRLNMRAEIRDPAALDAFDEAERRRELTTVHRKLDVEEIERRLEIAHDLKRAKCGRRLSEAALDVFLGPAEAIA